MFESQNGDFDIQKKHINDRGAYVVTAGLTNYGVLGKSDVEAKIFSKNTFYREFDYKMVTHARVFSLTPNFSITPRQGLFLANSLCFLSGEFGFDNMCSWGKIKSKTIQLPCRDNKIDFDFMESFIAELEVERIAELEAERIAELSAYLTVSGLDNYELSEEEENTLKNYNSLKWNTYNLEKLFGKSTRGKRLKGEDRIAGTLPFVTAGESYEGVSAYISNDVEIFEKNTTTIDMFGSAKYRNYRYGADDHIAVVHTESVPMKASIFLTSAIHKAAHTGKFDYGHNFYAKDADALDIMLPSKNGQPDYQTMELLIAAIQKLVIKDVVLYADRKIQATKEVVNIPREDDVE